MQFKPLKLKIDTMGYFKITYGFKNFRVKFYQIPWIYNKLFIDLVRKTFESSLNSSFPKYRAFW